MQEEFEKEIQLKMQEFHLEPTPAVWKEIDAALNEKKRRRFALWWWLLPLMLAAGIAVWLQQPGNKKESTIAAGKEDNSTENKSPKNITQENSLPEKKQTVNNKKDDHKTHQNTTELPDKTDVAGKTNNEKRNDPVKQLINYREHVLSNATADIDSIKRVTGNNQDPKKITDENLASQPVVQHDALRLNDTNEVTGRVPDKPEENPLNVEKKEVHLPVVIDQKDSSIATVNNAVKKITVPRKGKWLITVAAGTTATQEMPGSSELFSSSDALSVVTPGNATGSGNSADSSYGILKPKTGYQFSVGLLYQYELSKRWAFITGLRYRYLTTTQKTGNENKSLLNVQYNSSYSLNSYTRVPGYYDAGYSSDVKNTAHWMEIPFTVQYNLNPKAKTIYRLNAGLSYAWMFASKWLIPDSRYNTIYYSKKLLNNSIFNWQIGADVMLPSQWSIGLQYQQSLSTVAAKAVQPRLHWQNISLYTSFPLQFKKHSKK